MDWYVVDKKYVLYLTQFDSRVGYVEYGDRIKLHIGIVLEIHDKQYYVPVSSPKVKHYQMANSLDFLRIEDKTKASLYAVLNLNNMIPVPKECISKLRYNEIQKYRAFKSEKERSDYIYPLQNEKLIIDRMADTIKKKAERLYKSVIEKPYSRLAQRCCNFKSLEEALDKYMECGDS